MSDLVKSLLRRADRTRETVRTLSHDSTSRAALEEIAREYEYAAAALESAALQNDWRPIDTAPKNGTSIMVWVPAKKLPVNNAPSSKWKIFATRCIEVRWIVPPADDKSVTIGAYARELEARFGGYWTNDPRCIAPLRGMPTHWRPLLAPPGQPA